MRARPRPFPCPLWGLLEVKPGIFSKGHPFPRQCQALVPNRWWGWHTAAKTLASGAKFVPWSVLARLLFHCWLSPLLTKLTVACSASSSLSLTALTWVLERLLPWLSSQSYPSWHSSAISLKLFCCSYCFRICCVRTSLASFMMKICLTTSLRGCSHFFTCYTINGQKNTSFRSHRVHQFYVVILT